MGNTSTKEKTDHIDGGALLPHGVYSGPQDYDFRIVQRLIQQRKLAPFYKGLEDWDDNEDAQEEKARASSQHYSTTSSSHTARGTHHHVTDSERDMKRLYQGAIECPICFLYYPRNINRTRCCDKPMCTECFVQLKRLESAPTESPACPYCVEPHFGIIYSLALLPASLLSSPLATTSSPTGAVAAGSTSMSISSSNNSIERNSDSQSSSSPSTRRRSTSHKSPEVVTADELRPDWNRRILAAAQRQPGSRRASSSSVSNATFALGRRLAVGRQGSGSGSRRSNSSAAAADYNGYLTAMRNMGTDLEELMIMEAMRQSLQDEHDRISREAAASSNTTTTSGSGSGSGSSPLSTTTTTSNIGTSFIFDLTTSPPGGTILSGSSSESLDTSSPNSTLPRSNRRSRHGTLRSSPLSSPPAPPSTAMHLRTSSYTSGTSHEDGRDGRESDTETESDEESSERLCNRAIRFAAVTPIPHPQSSVETGGSMPKHRSHEGSTNHPPERV